MDKKAVDELRSIVAEMGICQVERCKSLWEKMGISYVLPPLLP